MSRFHKLAQVDDIEVLIDPGTINVEPRLLFKDGNKNIDFTLDSNLYENDLGEFMLNRRASEVHKDVIDKILDEIVHEMEDLGNITWFNLKQKYEVKVIEIVISSRN